jgi:Mg2+-importing ATPase
MNEIVQAFWSVAASELLNQLHTTSKGLTDDDASERLSAFGANLLKPRKRSNALSLFLAQFKSPLILILIFAAGLSLFVHDPTNALIILAIVFISGILGFWQERGAANAVEKLLAIVQTKAKVLRDGNPREVSFEEIVPGDIVILSAGGTIPGDCRILESRDLFVDEAALTGETYPVEKTVGTMPPEMPLSQRTNALFMGTHVVSGTAKVVIVRTGT